MFALAVTLLITPASAWGWANGPSSGEGFGTHDWIVFQANTIAVSRGASWVDINVAMSASDDPDTSFHDTYYHCYDIWGSTYGNSPAKVAECYGNAMSSLKAGDRVSASYYLGLLSHYYSDTCNPLHTDQTAAEDSMHSAYESAVDNITTSFGSLPGWVTDNGYAGVVNPTTLTQNAASVAHADYDALVSGYIAGGRSAVDPITRARLNQAANDIADIIKSIQDQAYPFVPVPNAVYRFYNTRTGTHFYTPDVDEALGVIANLSYIYSYEGIAYFADPTRNSQPLYRFYNKSNGSHFYTASPDEAGTVMARWGGIYSYDGPTYSVCLAPEASGKPVYRFYNARLGTHFYTADESERATVQATLWQIYNFEGPAFWVVQ